jgi:hypothetical protein
MGRGEGGTEREELSAEGAENPAQAVFACDFIRGSTLERQRAIRTPEYDESGC